MRFVETCPEDIYSNPRDGQINSAAAEITRKIFSAEKKRITGTEQEFQAHIAEELTERWESCEGVSDEDFKNFIEEEKKKFFNAFLGEKK